MQRLSRHEPVHVDMSELPQLSSELWGQDLVRAGGEISQCILHCLLLLLLRETVRPVGSVSNGGIPGSGGREGAGL